MGTATMFNEGASGGQKKSREDFVAKQRQEREARAAEKRGGNAALKIQRVFRGRRAFRLLRTNLVKAWDTQIQACKALPTASDLAHLLLILNFSAPIQEGPEVKRIVAMAALLVKAHKAVDTVPVEEQYWARLTMAPEASLSARQLAIFLSSALDALLAGKIPGQLEVVISKILLLATDPSNIEDPKAVLHLTTILTAGGRLASGASGIIRRQCKITPSNTAVPAPSAAALSALSLVKRMASTSRAPHSFLIRWLFSIPLLTRRLPEDSLSFCLASSSSWVELMVALPGALFLETQDENPTVSSQGGRAPKDGGPSGQEWRTWLLGNITELGFEVLMRDVQDASLCDAFFTALNILWDGLPKDVTSAMGMAKRDKNASVEEAGVLAQLRVVYHGKTVQSFFSPLLQASPKGRRHPWDACRPIAELYFQILATRQSLRTGVLNALTFGAKLISPLWVLLQESFPVALRQALSPHTHPLDSAVGLFVATLSHLLIISTEDDFYDSGVPLSLPDYARLARNLKEALLESLLRGGGSPAKDPSALYMNKVCEVLLLQLYNYDCRRAFCEPDSWLAPTKGPLTTFKKHPLQIPFFSAV